MDAEATYEELIALIETTQGGGRVSPILVCCDDLELQQQIIDRYESEARETGIECYRIVLGTEPSVRAAMAQLKASHEYLQNPNNPAVFSVTGIHELSAVQPELKQRLSGVRLPEDGQSEVDKLFGYFQWTREGWREFPYPIVLWMPSQIFLDVRRRAPDFWSWRKAALRFTSPDR